jgi:hypothetical protein
MKKEISRRDFFRGVGGVGLGTIGLGFGVSMLDGLYRYAEALTDEEKHTMLIKGTVNFKGFLAKEITPNEEFYITSYSSNLPDLDADSFRLGIEGLVERPYTLAMKDLTEMKDKTEFVTLECIGNSVGGDAIGNALWEGVTLRKIIERAAPKEGIVKIVFYAEDGYSDSIPYSLSLSDDVFLAFRMNGEPEKCEVALKDRARSFRLQGLLAEEGVVGRGCHTDKVPDSHAHGPERDTARRLRRRRRCIRREVRDRRGAGLP